MKTRMSCRKLDIARVDESVDLPTKWYGYEGVDVLVMTTSRADLVRPLTQNPTRVAALRSWVEMGGKLVIFCGSQADELLVEGGALADLLPGKYTESVTIEQSQSIEAFSGAEQSITPTRRVDLRVPVFTDIRGKVLASARRGGHGGAAGNSLLHRLRRIDFHWSRFRSSSARRLGRQARFLDQGSRSGHAIRLAAAKRRRRRSHRR